MDVLETLKKLPKVCAFNAAEAKKLGMEHPFLVHRGISGYDPRPGFRDTHCDGINEGITANQKEAMLAGSMFGWEVPAADPDTYDA
jgi:hypothetical protein